MFEYDIVFGEIGNRKNAVVKCYKLFYNSTQSDIYSLKQKNLLTWKKIHKLMLFTGAHLSVSSS